MVTPTFCIRHCWRNDYPRVNFTLLPHQASPFSRPAGLIMLRALLVCALMAQYAAVATNNSSTTAGPMLEEYNNTSEKQTDEAQDTIHILAIEYEEIKAPLIFTVVVLLAGLSKIGFHHANFLSSKIPESCMLVVLGTVFGAILRFSKIFGDLPELFSPHRFFVFLLPPIILESAFSLYDRTFSENIWTVLLFAVVGTVLACFLIGLSLYGLMMAGAMGAITNMTLVQILVFASLIVAVDPVAVLAVFAEIGVNDVLYFILFGESLLNDGVTVVLYKVMQTFNLMDNIAAAQIILGIIKFLVVCFGGLLLGVIAGIVTAVLTCHTTHVGVTQPLVIYTMAYLGFLMSELFEVSGIISIIACGLVQRHYAFSNISYKSRTTVKYFTKVLASASEIIIFLFLGLSLASENHEWHTGFVLWTLLLCTVFRFLLTFGMASLINRYDTSRVRRIGYDEMFMIAFGGLRGAVAFSLAELLKEEELPMKRMFVTTTLTIIMFTVFVQGITIKPLVTLLSITLAPEKNQSMFCELSNHVVDHLMAGIENVIGMHGRNDFRERIGQFDSCYLKKWLMTEPDPIDARLRDFYMKIVIKEHYRNLMLCGAVNVLEPPDMPHIDTSLYLSPLADKKSDVLVTQLAVNDDSGEEPVEMGTAVRRRSSRPGDPELPVTDWHGMRDLLRRQASRLTLHTNYNRNLASDLSSSLQNEIIKKSSYNRQLQSLMASTAHHHFKRSFSWTENNAQIARERGASAESKYPSSKRAVSFDLGVVSASYGPLTSRQSISSASGNPALDVVLEENEQTDSCELTEPARRGETKEEDEV